MRSFTLTTLWLLQKKKKYIGSVQEWQRTTFVTTDGCRIYLVSGQSGGKRKKSLVRKKKYCKVLLGNPLIWNTDREKCATRFIWSPKNCLCSTEGNLFWACYYATANSFALWTSCSSITFHCSVARMRWFLESALTGKKNFPCHTMGSKTGCLQKQAKACSNQGGIFPLTWLAYGPWQSWFLVVTSKE